MQALLPGHRRGIDVSRYQGTIDWMAVAASGIRFAFIKASEGVSYADPRLAGNVAGAAQAGIPAGLYHFARVHNDPLEEARWFGSIAMHHKTDLPDVLDIEEAKVDSQRVLSPDELVGWVLAWLQEVHGQTKRPVMVYSGAYFIKDRLAPSRKSSALRRYPLWVAHYGVTTPLSNSIWDQWSVFQYTSNGLVKGIRGPVDMNAMEDERPLQDSIRGRRS